MQSIENYSAAKSAAEFQFIQDGWELDDEEAAALHASRSETFNYMISIVREYDLPGDMALTPNAVDDLVKWKNDDNVAARIHFLESNEDTYRSYGGYWLLLAESYYEDNKWQKCLDALSEYEAIGVRLFRFDKDYAHVLPMAIVALREVCDDVEYTRRAADYAALIVANTESDDWALRYFAAQTYVQLYALTGDKDQLQAAYDIALDNVTALVRGQREMNRAYLAPVAETPVPKDATKAQKEEINGYNRMLKENRKTELVPLSDPLLLNCELLFALAEELDLPEDERGKIDAILHPGGEALFLNAPLDSAFWLESETAPIDDTGIDYAGATIQIPVTLVTPDSLIQVSVLDEGSDEPVVFTDWVLQSVRRDSGDELSGIVAVYVSESAKKHDWKPGAAATLTVTPMPDFPLPAIECRFTSVNAKNAWYNHLEFWNSGVAFERAD